MRACAAVSAVALAWAVLGLLPWMAHAAMSQAALEKRITGTHAYQSLTTPSSVVRPMVITAIVGKCALAGNAALQVHASKPWISAPPCSGDNRAHPTTASVSWWWQPKSLNCPMPGLPLTFPRSAVAPCSTRARGGLLRSVAASGCVCCVQCTMLPAGLRTDPLFVRVWPARPRGGAQASCSAVTLPARCPCCWS
jgi:hypothetical protein